MNFPVLKCFVQQHWCWLPCSLKWISTPGSGHNASSPQLAFLAAQAAKAANGDQAKLGTPGRRPKPGGDAPSPARAEPGTGTEATAAVSLGQESPERCPGSTPALWRAGSCSEAGEEDIHLALNTENSCLQPDRAVLSTSGLERAVLPRVLPAPQHNSVSVES